jgi:hypothetical protein
MRFTIDHPTEPSLTATYGHDPVVRFFLVVERAGRLVRDYDAFDPFYDGMPTLLAELVRFGFLSPEDVALGHQALAHHAVVTGVADPGVRRAATVILGLREAGEAG